MLSGLLMYSASLSHQVFKMMVDQGAYEADTQKRTYIISNSDDIEAPRRLVVVIMVWLVCVLVGVGLVTCVCFCDCVGSRQENDAIRPAASATYRQKDICPARGFAWATSHHWHISFEVHAAATPAYLCFFNVIHIDFGPWFAHI
jgi:hypothetical protein